MSNLPIPFQLDETSSGVATETDTTGTKFSFHRDGDWPTLVEPTYILSPDGDLLMTLAIDAFTAEAICELLATVLEWGIESGKRQVEQFLEAQCASG